MIITPWILYGHFKSIWVYMNQECSICWLRLLSQKYSNLDCGHKFHCKCLMKWLRKNPQCPYCRCPLDRNYEQFRFTLPGWRLDDGWVTDYSSDYSTDAESELGERMEESLISSFEWDFEPNANDLRNRRHMLHYLERHEFIPYIRRLLRVGNGFLIGPHNDAYWFRLEDNGFTRTLIIKRFPR